MGAPPKPAEADAGATRVELNPLERVQDLHAGRLEGIRPSDSKERTRPVNLAQGKSATPRVDALMRATTPAPSPLPPVAGEAPAGKKSAEGDSTAPGMKKRPLPVVAGTADTALGKAAARPFKIPDIKPRGSDDSTRELQRRPPPLQPPPDAGTRDIAPPREPTAPTREVMRGSASTSDANDTYDSSNEDDAATLLKPDGFSLSADDEPDTVRPENDLARAPTQEASRAGLAGFGNANPGDTSTSERTRLQMKPADDPPVAPAPVFSQQSMPPGQMPPHGYAPGSQHPSPGEFKPPSGDFRPPSGNFEQSSGSWGPLRDYKPPSGDYQSPILAPNARKQKKQMITLAVVFILSVGLGLAATLLLFR
mgnify:CR=1 FL=1